jgi:hypothetical protein
MCFGGVEGDLKGSEGDLDGSGGDLNTAWK